MAAALFVAQHFHHSTNAESLMEDFDIPRDTIVKGISEEWGSSIGGGLDLDGKLAVILKIKRFVSE